MNEKPPKQAVKTKQKTYNVKPKPIHYRAVQKLIDNGGRKGDALREAGYSESIATNPERAMNTKGFKQAMQELGLTDTFLVSALVHDIENKQNRFNELQLGFKLRGHLKETVQDSKTLILITSGESAKRYNVEPTS